MTIITGTGQEVTLAQLEAMESEALVAGDHSTAKLAQLAQQGDLKALSVCLHKLQEGAVARSKPPALVPFLWAIGTGAALGEAAVQLGAWLA